jgi:hypothetical protein
MAALSLAFTVNLFGSLTHYASGQVSVVVVGAGCVCLVDGGACWKGGNSCVAVRWAADDF